MGAVTTTPGGPPANAAEPDKIRVGVLSFGYAHGAAPRADRIEDVRGRWPGADAATPDVRDGFDFYVQDAVGAAEGASELVENLIEYVEAGAFSVPQYRLTLAIGCDGGRLRSVALAEMVAARLRVRDFQVDTWHRDVDRPAPAPAGIAPADAAGWPESGAAWLGYLTDQMLAYTAAVGAGERAAVERIAAALYAGGAWPHGEHPLLHALGVGLARLSRTAVDEPDDARQLGTVLSVLMRGAR